MKDVVPVEMITSKIYLIRGQKVMLDRDLAELYGVATKVLKQAARRNSKRFHEDFMFELSGEEFKNWRSQFVTSNGAEIRPTVPGGFRCHQTSAGGRRKAEAQDRVHGQGARESVRQEEGIGVFLSSVDVSG